jgi:hypothetical protein
VRDGVRREIEARLLVPGDLLLLAEGQRVSADAQLIDGAVQVDAGRRGGPFGFVVWGADELRRRHLRLKTTPVHPPMKEQPC